MNVAESCWEDLGQGYLTLRRGADYTFSTTFLLESRSTETLIIPSAHPIGIVVQLIELGQKLVFFHLGWSTN